MRPNIVTFLVVIIFSNLLNAQQIKTQIITDSSEILAHLKIELTGEFTNHNWVKFKQNGLFLYSRSTEKKGKTRKWKIEKYSNNLSLEKTKYIEIPKNYKFDKMFSNETDLYLLFSDSKNYSLFRFSAVSEQMEKATGILPSGSYVKHFSATENFIVFYAKKKHALSKSTPVLFTTHMLTGKQEPLVFNIDNYKQHYLKFTRMDVLPETKEMIINVEGTDPGNSKNFVFRFNSEGEQLSSFNLSENHGDLYFGGVTTTYMGEDTYFYCGNYWKEKEVTHGGVYLCKTKNNELIFLKFHEFSDFDNFSNFIPKNKNNKLRNLEYSTVSHGIKLIEGGYLYIGESRYKTYVAEGTDQYNNLSAKKLFAGYQYTHYSVGFFDGKGEKLWGKSYEMYQNETPKWRKEFINSIPNSNDNGLKLYFKDKKTIKTIDHLENGNTINRTIYDFTKLELEIDNTIMFSNYWYGNFFTVLGNKEMNTKEGSKSEGSYTIYKIDIK